MPRRRALANVVLIGFGIAYPLVVFFVIIVTANHFWFDAAAGAAVACMAAATSRQLARLRPDAWSWREDAADEATA